MFPYFLMFSYRLAESMGGRAAAAPSLPWAYQFGFEVLQENIKLPFHTNHDLWEFDVFLQYLETELVGPGEAGAAAVLPLLG